MYTYKISYIPIIYSLIFQLHYIPYIFGGLYGCLIRIVSLKWPLDWLSCTAKPRGFRQKRNEDVRLLRDEAVDAEIGREHFCWFRMDHRFVNVLNYST